MSNHIFAVYSLRLVKERTEKYEKIAEARCAFSASAARILQQLLAARPTEHFYILCMNNRNRVVGVIEAAHGGQSGLHVGVRDVLRSALISGCAAIIIGHNHPSGDPTPSIEDKAFTQRLVTAGAIVGVTVLDHVVISSEPENTAHFSFLDAGIMPTAVAS